MGKYILKRKLYTVPRNGSYTLYDYTDEFKKMNDSDILAQRKMQPPKQKSVGWEAFKSGLLGAGITAGVSAAGQQLLHGNIKGWRTSIPAIGVGAVAALSSGIKALRENRKNREFANEYNYRLKYAQAQARKREKADWKANMTLRDGYSY
jgi:hypothetical protein